MGRLIDDGDEGAQEEREVDEEEEEDEDEECVAAMHECLLAPLAWCATRHRR